VVFHWRLNQPRKAGSIRSKTCAASGWLTGRQSSPARSLVRWHIHRARPLLRKDDGKKITDKDKDKPKDKDKVKPKDKDTDKDKKDKDTDKDTDKDKNDQVQSATPATLVVTLPADATLTIDGNPTTSTSSPRVFVSPPLDPGKEFHYTLKATVMREGKPVEMVEKVNVRAGAQARVTLTIPTAVATR
jgi:uncharacterized protein (TIGR03000 family)